MKLIIKDNCIKCGACSEINGDIFEVTKYGAIINSNKIKPTNIDDCYDAIFVCPVNAIQYQ